MPQSMDEYLEGILPCDKRPFFFTMDLLRKFSGFKCLLCEFETKRSALIEEHVFVHSNGFPFKCGICQRRFSMRDGIYQHHNKDHPNESRIFLIHKDIVEKENYVIMLKNGTQINIDDIVERSNKLIAARKARKALRETDVNRRLNESISERTGHSDAVMTYAAVDLSKQTNSSCNTIIKKANATANMTKTLPIIKDKETNGTAICDVDSYSCREVDEASNNETPAASVHGGINHVAGKVVTKTTSKNDHITVIKSSNASLINSDKVDNTPDISYTRQVVTSTNASARSNIAVSFDLTVSCKNPVVSGVCDGEGKHCSYHLGQTKSSSPFSSIKMPLQNSNFSLSAVPVSKATNLMTNSTVSSVSNVLRAENLDNCAHDTVAPNNKKLPNSVIKPLVQGNASMPSPMLRVFNEADISPLGNSKVLPVHLATNGDTISNQPASSGSLNRLKFMSSCQTNTSSNLPLAPYHPQPEWKTKRRLDSSDSSTSDDDSEFDGIDLTFPIDVPPATRLTRSMINPDIKKNLHESDESDDSDDSSSSCGSQKRLSSKKRPKRSSPEKQIVQDKLRLNNEIPSTVSENTTNKNQLNGENVVCNGNSRSLLHLSNSNAQGSKNVQFLNRFNIGMLKRVEKGEQVVTAKDSMDQPKDIPKKIRLSHPEVEGKLTIQSPSLPKNLYSVDGYGDMSKSDIAYEERNSSSKNCNSVIKTEDFDGFSDGSCRDLQDVKSEVFTSNLQDETSVCSQPPNVDIMTGKMVSVSEYGTDNTASLELDCWNICEKPVHASGYGSYLKKEISEFENTANIGSDRDVKMEFSTDTDRCGFESNAESHMKLSNVSSKLYANVKLENGVRDSISFGQEVSNTEMKLSSVTDSRSGESETALSSICNHVPNLKLEVSSNDGDHKDKDADDCVDENLRRIPASKPSSQLNMNVIADIKVCDNMGLESCKEERSGCISTFSEAGRPYNMDVIADIKQSCNGVEIGDNEYSESNLTSEGASQCNLDVFPDIAQNSNEVIEVCDDEDSESNLTSEVASQCNLDVFPDIAQNSNEVIEVCDDEYSESNLTSEVASQCNLDVFPDIAQNSNEVIEVCDDEYSESNLTSEVASQCNLDVFPDIAQNSNEVIEVCDDEDSESNPTSKVASQCNLEGFVNIAQSSNEVIEICDNQYSESNLKSQTASQCNLDSMADIEQKCIKDEKKCLLEHCGNVKNSEAVNRSDINVSSYVNHSSNKSGVFLVEQETDIKVSSYVNHSSIKSVGFLVKQETDINVSSYVSHSSNKNGVFLVKQEKFNDNQGFSTECDVDSVSCGSTSGSNHSTHLIKCDSNIPLRDCRVLLERLDEDLIQKTGRDSCKRSKKNTSKCAARSPVRFVIQQLSKAESQMASPNNTKSQWVSEQSARGESMSSPRTVHMKEDSGRQSVATPIRKVDAVDSSSSDISNLVDVFDEYINNQKSNGFINSSQLEISSDLPDLATLIHLFSAPMEHDMDSMEPSIPVLTPEYDIKDCFVKLTRLDDHHGWNVGTRVDHHLDNNDQGVKKSRKRKVFDQGEVSDNEDPASQQTAGRMMSDHVIEKIGVKKEICGQTETEGQGGTSALNELHQKCSLLQAVNELSCDSDSDVLLMRRAYQSEGKRLSQVRGKLESDCETDHNVITDKEIFAVNYKRIKQERSPSKLVPPSVPMFYSPKSEMLKSQQHKATTSENNTLHSSPMPKLSPSVPASSLPCAETQRISTVPLSSTAHATVSSAPESIPKDGVFSDAQNLSMKHKRPVNSFILWATEQRKWINRERPDLSQGIVSKILAIKWNSMSDAEKQPYSHQHTRVTETERWDKTAYIGQMVPSASNPFESRSITSNLNREGHGITTSCSHNNTTNHPKEFSRHPTPGSTTPHLTSVPNPEHSAVTPIHRNTSLLASTVPPCHIPVAPPIYQQNYQKSPKSTQNQQINSVIEFSNQVRNFHQAGVSMVDLNKLKGFPHQINQPNNAAVRCDPRPATLSQSSITSRPLHSEITFRPRFHNAPVGPYRLSTPHQDGASHLARKAPTQLPMTFVKWVHFEKSKLRALHPNMTNADIIKILEAAWQSMPTGEKLACLK